jgi:hypothetical protein
MKFYVKNPEIEHDVTVQGKNMGKDTVVCGEEFAPFADPGTFPGWTPKLVEVSFEKLTEAQRLQARGVAEEQTKKPPRHLGVITSENISHPEGKLKISAAGPPDVTKKDKAKAKVEPPEQPGLRGPEKDKPDQDKPVTKEEIIKTFDKGLPRLTEMYSTGEFAEIFPGVTPKNAVKVMKSFLSLDELATASNVELRKTGIRANFFDRLRKKAGHEKDEFESKRG